MSELYELISRRKLSEIHDGAIQRCCEPGVYGKTVACPGARQAIGVCRPIMQRKPVYCCLRSVSSWLG